MGGFANEKIENPKAGDINMCWCSSGDLDFQSWIQTKYLETFTFSYPELLTVNFTHLNGQNETYCRKYVHILSTESCSSFPAFIFPLLFIIFFYLTCSISSSDLSLSIRFFSPPTHPCLFWFPLFISWRFCTDFSLKPFNSRHWLELCMLHQPRVL